jgi:antitoxin component YwqK of YwqJK toxin-antitoxin module
VETYNTDGNRIERSVFQDGQISSKVISFYENRGRNIGNDSFSSSLDKTLTTPSKTKLTLNAKGNVVTMKFYSALSNGKPDHEYTYKYDARGNEIELNYGKAKGKSVMTFDKNNNKTSEMYFNGEGVVDNKNFIEYNEKNQETKWSIYERETLRYEFRYKYDEKGRVSEIETREFNIVPNVHYSDAPEAGKVIYTYDEKRKTSWKTKYLLNGTPIPNSTTIFNEQKEEIGLYCENGELTTCKTVFEYVFDARNNLMKKICYGRSFYGDTLRPSWAEERVISYY